MPPKKRAKVNEVGVAVTPSYVGADAAANQQLAKEETERSAERRNERLAGRDRRKPLEEKLEKANASEALHTDIVLSLMAEITVKDEQIIQLEDLLSAKDSELQSAQEQAKIKDDQTLIEAQLETVRALLKKEKEKLANSEKDLVLIEAKHKTVCQMLTRSGELLGCSKKEVDRLVAKVDKLVAAAAATAAVHALQIEKEREEHEVTARCLVECQGRNKDVAEARPGIQRSAADQRAFADLLRKTAQLNQLIRHLHRLSSVYVTPQPQ
jgi:hypothetical protein